MKLSRWAKGGKSKSQSNAEKGWLLPAEVDKVIEYAVEMANRGFPRFVVHGWELDSQKVGSVSSGHIDLLKNTQRS